MEGGLLQLAVKGREDVNLTSEPEFSYYEMVYKKHTNFSIQNNLYNLIGKKFGQSVEFKIPKGSDLLSDINLEVYLPKLIENVKTIKIEENLIDYTININNLKYYLIKTGTLFYLIPEYILINNFSIKLDELEKYELNDLDFSFLINNVDNFYVIDYTNDPLVLLLNLSTNLYEKIIIYNFKKSKIVLNDFLSTNKIYEKYESILSDIIFNNYDFYYSDVLNRRLDNLNLSQFNEISNYYFKIEGKNIHTLNNIDDYDELMDVYGSYFDFINFLLTNHINYNFNVNYFIDRNFSNTNPSRIGEIIGFNDLIKPLDLFNTSYEKTYEVQRYYEKIFYENKTRIDQIYDNIEFFDKNTFYLNTVAISDYLVNKTSAPLLVKENSYYPNAVDIEVNFLNNDFIRIKKTTTNKALYDEIVITNQNANNSLDIIGKNANILANHVLFLIDLIEIFENNNFTKNIQAYDNYSKDFILDLSNNIVRNVDYTYLINNQSNLPKYLTMKIKELGPIVILRNKVLTLLYNLVNIGNLRLNIDEEEEQINFNAYLNLELKNLLCLRTIDDNFNQLLLNNNYLIYSEDNYENYLNKINKNPLNPNNFLEVKLEKEINILNNNFNSIDILDINGFYIVEINFEPLTYVNYYYNNLLLEYFKEEDKYYFKFIDNQPEYIVNQVFSREVPYIELDYDISNNDVKKLEISKYERLLSCKTNNYLIFDKNIDLIIDNRIKLYLEKEIYFIDVCNNLEFINKKIGYDYDNKIYLLKLIKNGNIYYKKLKLLGKTDGLIIDEDIKEKYIYDKIELLVLDSTFFEIDIELKKSILFRLIGNKILENYDLDDINYLYNIHFGINLADNFDDINITNLYRLIDIEFLNLSNSFKQINIKNYEYYIYGTINNKTGYYYPLYITDIEARINDENRLSIEIIINEYNLKFYASRGNFNYSEELTDEIKKYKSFEKIEISLNVKINRTNFIGDLNLLDDVEIESINELGVKYNKLRIYHNRKLPNLMNLSSSSISQYPKDIIYDYFIQQPALIKLKNTNIYILSNIGFDSENISINDKYIVKLSKLDSNQLMRNNFTKTSFNFDDDILLISKQEVKNKFNELLNSKYNFLKNVDNIAELILNNEKSGLEYLKNSSNLIRTIVDNFTDRFINVSDNISKYYKDSNNQTLFNIYGSDISGVVQYFTTLEFQNSLLGLPWMKLNINPEINNDIINVRNFMIENVNFLKSTEDLINKYNSSNIELILLENYQKNIVNKNELIEVELYNRPELNISFLDKIIYNNEEIHFEIDVINNRLLFNGDDIVETDFYRYSENEEIEEIEINYITIKNNKIANLIINDPIFSIIINDDNKFIFYRDILNGKNKIFNPKIFNINKEYLNLEDSNYFRKMRHVYILENINNLINNYFISSIGLIIIKNSDIILITLDELEKNNNIIKLLITKKLSDDINNVIINLENLENIFDNETNIIEILELSIVKKNSFKFYNILKQDFNLENYLVYYENGFDYNFSIDRTLLFNVENKIIDRVILIERSKISLLSIFENNDNKIQNINKLEIGEYFSDKYLFNENICDYLKLEDNNYLIYLLDYQDFFYDLSLNVILESNSNYLKINGNFNLKSLIGGYIYYDNIYWKLIKIINNEIISDIYDLLIPINNNNYSGTFKIRLPINTNDVYKYTLNNKIQIINNFYNLSWNFIDGLNLNLNNEISYVKFNNYLLFRTVNSNNFKFQEEIFNKTKIIDKINNIERILTISNNQEDFYYNIYTGLENNLLDSGSYIYLNNENIIVLIYSNNEKILKNVYTDNKLFNVSIINLHYVKITFDFNNLTNKLNEGRIFILKNDENFNIINLVVYKNQIYDSLKINVNNNNVIEPINLSSLDSINLVNLNINDIIFDDNILDVDINNSLKVRTYNENININYEIDVLKDMYLDISTNDYEIINLLSYKLNYIGLLKDSNEMVNDNIILKNDNNFVIGNDVNFKNRYSVIEKYEIVKEILYNYNGYIDKNGILFLENNFIISNIVIKINGIYYYVLKSWGNICTLKIFENDVNTKINYPYYFNKILIVGSFNNNTFNYLDHLLHLDRNNLFKAINNSNLLNRGDYFIKNNILNINSNQNQDNCFGTNGNNIKLKTFKNMIYLENSFLLDLKILDIIYDISNNYKEYKIERILDNIILLDDYFTNNIVEREFYVPSLNYILVKNDYITSGINLMENKYGLKKIVKVEFEFKVDLCVNWYNNSPNRYSNKVKFNRLNQNTFKIIDGLDLSRLNFYFNQVLGVCKDFSIIDYVIIKDFDLENNIIITDKDINLDSLLFVFDSIELLKDDLFVLFDKNNEKNYIMDMEIIPYYKNKNNIVNLILFYIIDNKSYSTNFIVEIYFIDNEYKITSEELAIYLNTYILNNQNILYVIDGINLIKLVSEDNFVFKIENIELNPKNIVLITEIYENNKFLTLVKIHNNYITSQLKIHSNNSKFLVNNLFEIKIKDEIEIEYIKPDLKLIKNYRDVSDYYLMVYVLNIKQKEPKFDTIINKFLIEIEFVQDYEDITLESLLLYKIYSDLELTNNLKLINIDNKVFIETDLLLNYNKLFIGQNIQIRTKNNFNFIDNMYENNLLKPNYYLHQFINLRWYGIRRNYLVEDNNIDYMNKNVDINKPFNSVLKIYEDNQNFILETRNQLLNIPNNTGVSTVVDIYQNIIVNDLEITTYSTMNNFYFIKFNLNLLYKSSKNNLNLMNILSLFKKTKNIKFNYTDIVTINNDNNSVFLDDEVFYYDVIVSLDVINGLAYELRQMSLIILDIIENNNNYGFWINWKEVIEYKINQYGYTINGNCLHKIDEELDSDIFIKTDNGYIRKNGITMDVDIVYDNSMNMYELRRDITKLNNYVDNLVMNFEDRFGINIDILLNNIDFVLKNNIDLNYQYKNEIKNLNDIYLELLWNKYKYDSIYSNINPNILNDDKIYKYEIDLGVLDEDKLDSTDILIYNENELNNPIILSKKVIFYENEINTNLLTLSKNVKYNILSNEYLGNYYRIDMNNNTFNDNLRIKLGENFINLIEIEDRVMYVAMKEEVNQLDHIEYVNNIYVKNGNLLVIDYNSSFNYQKSYIRYEDNYYFTPNNYQNTKIYFYCKQFGINLGLSYNLDVSKNEIDYHQKIKVQIINNKFVFDVSLNQFEKGKIYLFDLSHISNLNYPLRIAEDLSFNEYYYNSYGLAGENKVIYFAPIKLGKVYFYVLNDNLENFINDPYDFGSNYNGIDIIDGSENIINVDVSVNLITRTYELSNTNFITGKIYKFNILNFNVNNFGLTLNLYYLYSKDNGNTYIPVVLDDKIVNASQSLIIKKDFIYELIEVRDILNLKDFDKKVYKINSDEIIRNSDYISNNVEDNIFIETINNEILKPFKVIIKSLSEFIVIIDNNIDIKNIVHYSNLNQSLPLNVNTIVLENKIYYDIYVRDNIISNDSNIVLKYNNNNLYGEVVNRQFIINSDRSLDLDNQIIINNIFKLEGNTDINSDISFIYLKIPNDLVLTFVSSYDLKYIVSISSDIIIDYSNSLIIDSSNIVNNKFRINSNDISYNEGMDLYLIQYVKYTDENKLFYLAENFNEIKVEPNLEINYDSYLFEIRNNDNYDFIYGIDLLEELIDFNYYVDKIYLLYNDNKLITLDFIYLDQVNKKQLIVGTNVNVYNINKLLIKGEIKDIKEIINIKKQFRGKKYNDKLLIGSDIYNLNSNFLSVYYKLKISGFNRILINNKFINNKIIINKEVEKIETIENKVVENEYIDDVVFRLFKKISFYINDELIEELTPDIYLMIYNFHYKENKKNNILKLSRNGDNYKFSLPLEFWFIKNHLNLPLLAMNNTNLYIRFEMEDLGKLLKSYENINKINKYDLKLIVDMNTILLDDNERLLFGSKGHEYLIERYVDYKNYRLNKLQSVNRIPIKGLIKNIYWFGYNYETNEPYVKNEIIENEIKYQEYLDLMEKYKLYLNNNGVFINEFSILSKNKKLLLTSSKLIDEIQNSLLLNKYDIEFVLFLYEKYINPKTSIRSIINRLNLYFVHLYYSNKKILKEPIMKEINIKINGTTLCGKRDNLYYNYVLPNKNLTNIPDDNYYFWTFALHPEEQQPSGHLNFNKLDEFVIISNNNEKVVNEAYQLKVITKEYQIIKIMGGMCSLIW